MVKQKLSPQDRPGVRDKASLKVVFQWLRWLYRTDCMHHLVKYVMCCGSYVLYVLPILVHVYIYIYHPLVCITFYSATWHCIGIYIYICVIMGHHDEHLNLRREKQHLHTWQLKKQLWNPGPKHRSKITTSPQKMRPNMRGVDSATCRRIQLEYVVVKHPTTTFTQGCELKLLQF